MEGLLYWQRALLQAAGLCSLKVCDYSDKTAIEEKILKNCGSKLILCEYFLDILHISS